SSSPLPGWQPCPTGQRYPFDPLSLQELLRYYGQLRPSLWHRYSSSWCLPLVISLSIQGEVLTFRTKACVELMPPKHRLPRPVDRFLPGSSLSYWAAPVLTVP